MKPVWIPPALDAAFRNSVIRVFTTPHIYHPTLAPVPWLIALFGRPGLEKLEVMERLCLSYGLYASYKSIVVKIGHTTAAMDEIRCTAQATFEVIKQEKDAGLLIVEDKGSRKPDLIIFIDHADLLCYEPDSDQCLLESIALKKLCEDNNVLIVGIFDRLPGETPPQTSPWAKECQNMFFAQFETLLYIESPSLTFRIELFQFYISEFITHYNKTHGTQTISSALKEDDYQILGNYSTFATPENILYFLRKVFLNILHADGKDEILKTGLTLEYIENFTNTRFGAPHICTYDVRDADNRFATMCGQQPSVKLSAPQPQMVATKGFTAFTEDNVDLNQVMATLAKGEEEEEDDLESEAKRIKTE